MWTVPVPLIVRWLLLALVLVLPADLARAADEAVTADVTEIQRAAQLVEDIEAEYAKLEELRSLPEGESGEQLRVRQRQLADEELRVGTLIHDLGELVLSAPGDPQLADVRRKLMDWLRRLPRDVTQVIERREALLEGAKKARDEAPAEAVLEFEEQVTSASRSLDQALQYYAQQLKLLDAAGIDAGPSREQLLERLTDRADTVAARVRVTREERDQLAEVIENAPGDTASKLRSVQLDQRLDASIESLRLLVDQLQALGADTTVYQKMLVRATGDISDIGLSTSVLSALIDDAWRASAAWLTDSGPQLVGETLVVLLILLLSWYLARVARRLVERAFTLRHSSASVLLQATVSRITGQLIIGMGLLIALSQLGVSVGPMLAGLGIAGFVIGFALQDTLSNFASGGFILFYRPFDVGDVVEAGGVFGTVQAMTLVSTTIHTFDNQTLIVPNSKIWGDVIRNVTRQTTRRVDLTFGISYGDDVQRAEALLMEIVQADERVLDNPPPQVRLHELGDSAVSFIVRPWVRREDYWDVYWDLTKAVKLRFDAEGITFPFPQRDVHHHYPDSVPDQSSGAA